MCYLIIPTGQAALDIVPSPGAIRCLDVDGNNKISRVIPMGTPGTEVWDWAQGYSNPRINIRMEVCKGDVLCCEILLLFITFILTVFMKGGLNL